MEGIPGSHEPSCFTVRWSRQSWRLPHRSVHAQPSLRRDGVARGRVNIQEHVRRNVSTGGKRKRRQGCQRLGRNGTVGRQRPRSRSPSGNGKNARLTTCRISARQSEESDVKRSPPRSSRADPKVRGVPTSRKRRSDPGTNEVRVHAVHVRVAEVDQTHFASCPPFELQGSVVEPAGR